MPSDAKWVVCSAGGGKEGEQLIQRCWEIAQIFPDRFARSGQYDRVFDDLRDLPSKIGRKSVATAVADHEDFARIHDRAGDLGDQGVRDALECADQIRLSVTHMRVDRFRSARLGSAGQE